MGGPKFFVTAEAVDDSHVEITGSQVKHLLKVRRCRLGEVIWIADGSGRQFEAEVESMNSERIVARILRRESQSPELPPIVLFQGLLKGPKMDSVFRVATELGAAAIHALLTERAVSSLSGGASLNRIGRWERIVLEAAKQARRMTLPRVPPPMTWSEALECLKEMVEDTGARENKIVVFWEGEREQLLGDILPSEMPKRLAVVIGPEGGLTQEEVADLKSLGGETVTLGEDILRSETAAVAALALVGYELRRLRRNSGQDEDQTMEIK